MQRYKYDRTNNYTKLKYEYSQDIFENMIDIAIDKYKTDNEYKDDVNRIFRHLWYDLPLDK